MKRRTTIVILGLGILLAILIFPNPAAKPASAEAMNQSAPRVSLPLLQASDAETCRLIIEKTVARLGWSESDIVVTDYGGEDFTCGIYDQYIGSNIYPFSIQIYSTALPVNSWPPDSASYSECSILHADCTWVDIHGLPGRQGSGYIKLAVEFYDPSCNLLFRITKPPFQNQFLDYTPVSDALYDSAVEIGCGQATGEIPPGDSQSIPNNPGDQAGNNQPASLGPLVTTPLIPLAGALIGTVIGWLISVAATSGNVLRTSVAPPLSPAPPTTSPGPVPPVPAGEPPAPTAKPGPQKEIEDGMIAVKKSPVWDESTTRFGDTASIMGAIKDFVDFDESPETLKQLRDSLQAWRQNPTSEAAGEYLKNLRGTTNLRVQKIADTLGVVGKVVDVTDAVMTGLTTAQERGYKGMDKALTVGAEVVKKDLT